MRASFALDARNPLANRAIRTEMIINLKFGISSIPEVIFWTTLTKPMTASVIGKEPKAGYIFLFAPAAAPTAKKKIGVQTKK